MRLVLSVTGLLALLAFLASTGGPGSAVEAGTARRMDVAGLVDASGLIVEADVVSAHGRIGARELIETELLLDVERTFWGPEVEQQVVRVPGGVLPDGRGLLLSGMPRIEAGERVILFLTPESESGVRMPVGLAQGKFAVERTEEGGVQLVREHPGLRLAEPGGEVAAAQPRSVHDYAAVVSEIHAAVAARAARSGGTPDESGR